MRLRSRADYGKTIDASVTAPKFPDHNGNKSEHCGCDQDTIQLIRSNYHISRVGRLTFCTQACGIRPNFEGGPSAGSNYKRDPSVAVQSVSFGNRVKPRLKKERGAPYFTLVTGVLDTRLPLVALCSTREVARGSEQSANRNALLNSTKGMQSSALE